MPRAKKNEPKPPPQNADELAARLLASVRDDDPEDVREWLIAMGTRGERANGEDCQPRTGGEQPRRA